MNYDLIIFHAVKLLKKLKYFYFLKLYFYLCPVRKLFGYIILLIWSSSVYAQMNMHKDSLLSENTFDIKSFQWDTLYLRTTRKPNFCLKDTTGLSLKTIQHAVFRMPVLGNIISEFGYRSHRRVHTGVDIKLNYGDSVYAVFDGIVRISRYFSSYGNIVVVRHFNGIETAYAHLSKRFVHVGDTIYSGKVLGLGGKTGRATTPHLHFETRYREQPFNPRLLIDFTEKKLHHDTLWLCQNSFQFNKKKSTVIVKHAIQKSTITTPDSNVTTIVHQEPFTVNKVYVIQKGDTLYSLAKRYDTTVGELCKVNHIHENGILSIGQKIRIP